MQIVNGFVCMNCTDVERAQKFIDPAHPKQAAGTEPRDAATDTPSPAGTLTRDAVSFGGSLAHLNALDTQHPPGARSGPAGANLDILA